MTKGHLTSLLGTVALVLGCGCAPWRTDLVRQGVVAVEAGPSPRVELFWISARQHAGHLDVWGHARSRRRSAFPCQGHVDVSVLSPDGHLLAAAHTQDFRVPRRRRRQAPGGRRFRTHLPIAVRQAATVLVAFHSGSHEAEACAVAP